VESRDSVRKFFRPQDVVWVLLFTAVAIFGPDRTPVSAMVLIGLGVFQVIEPKVPFLTTTPGIVVSFAIKLALWYVLMGWTDGIASSYYWVILLPVISTATSAGLVGLVVATLIACGAYLSYLLLLPNGTYVIPEEWPQLILRMASIPVGGFLTYELLEANRTATRRAQAAVEQLGNANRQLQEAEAAVRRSDRLAALGQLSAGLAHELRNPLGTIKTSAEMLLKNVPADNAVAREMAGFISTEVDRTNSLVTRFLDFARPLAVRLEKTDLTQVIDQAVSDVEKHQPPFDVTIYKNCSPEIPPFFLDGELMERVIYNLLLNAAQASPPAGSVTVKTRQSEGTVEIAVIDRGVGIQPKLIENIFNPFYTTKSSGVGLGLAIVSKIVDEHGGSIAVESEPGEGSVFRVYLPFRESLKEDGR
jgi:two-component system sensor histidine kinase HydH